MLQISDQSKQLEEQQREIALLAPQIADQWQKQLEVDQRVLDAESKAKKAEQQAARFDHSFAKKETLSRFSSQVKSQLQAYDGRIEQVKNTLLSTDLHLDRYLPVKILNLMKDVHEDAISSYGDRKVFLTNLESQFSELQKKIDAEEAADLKADPTKRFPLKRQCHLRKEYYDIPSIEIPESLSYDDEDEDSAGESEQSLGGRVIEEEEDAESDSAGQSEVSDDSMEALDQVKPADIDEETILGAQGVDDLDRGRADPPKKPAPRRNRNSKAHHKQATPTYKLSVKPGGAPPRDYSYEGQTASA